MRILLQEDHQLLGNHVIHGSTGFAVAQLLLGLALELGLADLNADDGSQTLADIIAVQTGLAVLQELIFPRVIIKGLGQRVFETGQVGSTLRSIDVITKL